jgi:hypothetical protein
LLIVRPAIVVRKDGRVHQPKSRAENRGWLTNKFNKLTGAMRIREATSWTVRFRLKHLVPRLMRAIGMSLLA